MKCRYELSANDLKEIVCTAFGVSPGFVTITCNKETIGEGTAERTEHVVKCYIESNSPLSDLFKSNLNLKFSTK